MRNFLFFLGSQYDKLNQMMDELDNHYEPKVEKYEVDMMKNQPVLTPHTFTVGDLVAAVWQTDQMWYRGVVKSIKEDQYEVFLFDYGDTISVRQPYIWPLDRKFFNLPKQAIKAKLSGRIASPVHDVSRKRLLCRDPAPPRLRRGRGLLLVLGSHREDAAADRQLAQEQPRHLRYGERRGRPRGLAHGSSGRR